MVKFVTSFLRDESGASAAEYALILAIIGSGIAVAAVALGDSITLALDGSAKTIAKCAGATGC
jgi:pilus assembly protein Flp/PilA